MQIEAFFAPFGSSGGGGLAWGGYVFMVFFVLHMDSSLSPSRRKVEKGARAQKSVTIPTYQSTFFCSWQGKGRGGGGYIYITYQYQIIKTNPYF